MGPRVVQLDLMVEVARRHFVLVLIAADAGRNARSAAHIALAKAARQTEEASSVLSEHLCRTNPCRLCMNGVFFPRISATTAVVCLAGMAHARFHSNHSPTRLP